MVHVCVQIEAFFLMEKNANAGAAVPARGGFQC
jgi:hypothetical protein